MRVLVTGGAGYIGSFVARAVAARGHHAQILDDLSRGHEWAAGDIPLHRMRCGDVSSVESLLRRESIDSVIHLAALSQVGESVAFPARYWRENLGGAAGLLDACASVGIKRFVLSSTAAVYGEPIQTPIDEGHPTQPTNPYGSTKRAIEELLAQARLATGMGFVSLRYFNAAGAMPDGSLGEDHTPETHLIPLAIDAAAGNRGPLTIFGDDYPTPDGTCVRDYVHVLDLAVAHVRALDWLSAHGGDSLICNLGGGKGHSVREVLDTVGRVVGTHVPRLHGARRPGDPAVLVASIDRAQRELGWKPDRSHLSEIVTDAWAWHRSRHPAD